MLKAQILIWRLFTKAQLFFFFGIYFHKTQMLIWYLFYKAQNNIWQKQLLYAQSPNTNLAFIFQSSNIILATIS